MDKIDFVQGLMVNGLNIHHIFLKKFVNVEKLVFILINARKQES